MESYRPISFNGKFLSKYLLIDIFAYTGTTPNVIRLLIQLSRYTKNLSIDERKAIEEMSNSCNLRLKVDTAQATGTLTTIFRYLQNKHSWLKVLKGCKY